MTKARHAHGEARMPQVQICTRDLPELFLGSPAIPAPHHGIPIIDNVDAMRSCLRKTLGAGEQLSIEQDCPYGPLKRTLNEVGGIRSRGKL